MKRLLQQLGDLRAYVMVPHSAPAAAKFSMMCGSIIPLQLKLIGLQQELAYSDLDTAFCVRMRQPLLAD